MRLDVRCEGSHCPVARRRRPVTANYIAWCRVPSANKQPITTLNLGIEHSTAVCTGFHCTSPTGDKNASQAAAAPAPVQRKCPLNDHQTVLTAYSTGRDDQKFTNCVLTQERNITMMSATSRTYKRTPPNVTTVTSAADTQSVTMCH